MAERLDAGGDCVAGGLGGVDEYFRAPGELARQRGQRCLGEIAHRVVAQIAGDETHPQNARGVGDVPPGW